MHQCQADDDANLIDLGVDELTRASIWELHDQFVNTYVPNKHPLSSPNEKRIVGIINSNARHSNDEGSRGFYTNGSDMRVYAQAGEELCQWYSDRFLFVVGLTEGSFSRVSSSTVESK